MQAFLPLHCTAGVVAVVDVRQSWVRATWVSSRAGDIESVELVGDMSVHAATGNEISPARPTQHRRPTAGAGATRVTSRRVQLAPAPPALPAARRQRSTDPRSRTASASPVGPLIGGFHSHPSRSSSARQPPSAQPTVKLTTASVPSIDVGTNTEGQASLSAPAGDAVELARRFAADVSQHARTHSQPESSASIPSPPISPLSEQPATSTFVPGATLILLDWDDTLLPARASTRFTPPAQSRPTRVAKIPTKVADSLRLLSQDVIGLLKACSALGRVMIVTNAMAGWVESSCAGLMPDVLKHIQDENIAVVSAQQQFATERQRFFRSADPMEWKVTCFERIVDAVTKELRQDAQDGAVGLNLVSIGDSLYERFAAKRLVAIGKVARCKTVKFLDEPQPTIARLRAQIASLWASLETIVCASQSFDVDLEL